MSRNIIEISENNRPYAIIKDAEELRKVRFELVWKATPNSNKQDTVLVFKDKNQFALCLKAFKVSRNRMLDMRSDLNKKAIAASNSAIAQLYYKTATVKAMQFRLGENEVRLERFITSNGGKHVKQGDKYRIPYFGGGHEFLRDEDYIMCSQKGDVYVCKNEVKEEIYRPQFESEKEMQNYDPTQVNRYVKIKKVKALQYLSGKNNEQVEAFITDNGGRYNKYEDTVRGKRDKKSKLLYDYQFMYRVHSHDAGDDYLHDKDFILCQQEGDVYPCPTDVFISSYELAIGSTEEGEDVELF